MGTYDWLGAVVSAQSHENPVIFIAFDTETTGLEPERDRIVEIGAIKFDYRGIISRFSVLMNPGFPMPKEASNVNGITDDQLKGKPPPEAILPDFLRFIDNGIVIAHNAPFDISFVNEELRKAWEKWKQSEEDYTQSLFMDNIQQQKNSSPLWQPPYKALPHKIVDTRILAKEVLPPLPRYGLQDLASYFGIEIQQAHRALDDARVCMEVFLKCIEYQPQKKS